MKKAVHVTPTIRLDSVLEKIRALDEVKLSALEKYLLLIEEEDISEQEFASGLTQLWKQSRSFDFLTDSEVYIVEDAVARYEH